jgi:hypothetical protein
MNLSGKSTNSLFRKKMFACSTFKSARGNTQMPRFKLEIKLPQGVNHADGAELMSYLREKVLFEKDGVVVNTGKPVGYWLVINDLPKPEESEHDFSMGEPSR